jgi:3-carboxy-cis,cis-muconate cycloisomerase
MTDNGPLAPAWAGTDVASLVDDEALIAAMVDTEVALAEAQAELGTIPPAAAAAIRVAGKAAAIDPAVLAAGVRATANPVVAFVEQFTTAVAVVDADAAEYVHRGGTSQDILDTALMLLASSVLDRIETDLRTCAAGLAELAERHKDTPMAGRTLTQHAVPVTFGLKAAGWLHLVLESLGQVRRVRGGLPVSIGGAAGTLAAYAAYHADPAGHGGGTGDDDVATLPDLVASRLGLTAPPIPWHALRTPIAELAAALLITTGSLGKIAADVLVLSRTEIREVVEECAPGRGASSAMPQKRNPVYATLVATAARQLPPLATVLFQSMVAEDERSSGAWHAEWQPLRDCLRGTAGATANAVELIGSLRVDTDRMLDNLALTRGAVVSERANATLAPVLGKLTAKRLIADASAEADRTGRDLAVVLAEALAGAGVAVDGAVPDLTALLDPANYTGLAARLTDRVVARYRELERR